MTATASDRRPPLPWPSMAATALLWGSAFAAIRIALDGYTPAGIAVLRIAVAVLLLLPGLLAGKIGRPAKADLPRLAAFGITGLTGYQLLLYSGERSVDGGTAAMLVTTSPVFATLLAVAFLGERPGRRGILGLAVALSGALLIAVTAGHGGHSLTGAALVVLAAASQATSFALQKPLLQRYSGTECTFYGSLFGLLPLLPALPSALAHARTAAYSQTAAVLWLGLACTAAAFWTWSRALRATTASVCSLVLYGVPVAALAVDAALLGGMPTPVALLGGALVLTGVIVAATARTSSRHTVSRVRAGSAAVPEPATTRRAP